MGATRGRGKTGPTQEQVHGWTAGRIRFFIREKEPRKPRQAANGPMTISSMPTQMATQGCTGPSAIATLWLGTSFISPLLPGLPELLGVRSYALTLPAAAVGLNFHLGSARPAHQGTSHALLHSLADPWWWHLKIHSNGPTTLDRQVFGSSHHRLSQSRTSSRLLQRESEREMAARGTGSDVLDAFAENRQLRTTERARP